MSEIIDISWNEFQSCTRDTFRNLLLDTYFTDVTLVCEDEKQLKAHKVILSACSSFFNNILVRNHHDNMLIYLKGIKYKDLEAIIKFIYLGQISIKEGDLEDFMKTAKELEIKELLWNSMSNEETNTKLISDDFLTNDSITFSESYTSDSQNVFEDLVEEFNKYKYDENNTIRCDQCKYRTNKQGELKKHKESVHSAQVYKCDGCEKIFKTQAMCKEHKQIAHLAGQHLGIPARPISQYPCNLCDYTAASQLIMRLHKERKH